MVVVVVVVGVITDRTSDDLSRIELSRPMLSKCFLMH